MTVYLPSWKTLKWFISPASCQTVWTQTVCGPWRWNPMFPRQVDKKCQEETCTFKGQATGKGLWVGLCCVQWQLSVRACCLLLSLQFQNRKKKKKQKIRPFCQSWRLTNPRSRRGVVNNETILSSRNTTALRSTTWSNSLTFCLTIFTFRPRVR